MVVLAILIASAVNSLYITALFSGALTAVNNFVIVSKRLYIIRFKAEFMEMDLLLQGVDLMLFGMATVFVFLTVLVVVTVLMSRLVITYFPEDSPAEKVAPGPAPMVASNAAIDSTHLTVIKIAIEKHRARHK